MSLFAVAFSTPNKFSVSAVDGGCPDQPLNVWFLFCRLFSLSYNPTQSALDPEIQETLTRREAPRSELGPGSSMTSLLCVFLLPTDIHGGELTDKSYQTKISIDRLKI